MSVALKFTNNVILRSKAFLYRYINLQVFMNGVSKTDEPAITLGPIIVLMICIDDWMKLVSKYQQYK